MKKIIFILTLTLFAFYAKAQENISSNNEEIKTLFGEVKSSGGYGAPVYRFGIINKHSAYINGGRGAWIINHKFAFGGGGTSFKSEIMYDNSTDVNYQITGGYGGLLFEPILMYKFPIHLTIPILIGGGGYSYTVKDYMNEDYIEDTKAFFVAEPGLEFELNVLKFFRLNFGAYYRYTIGNRLRYYDGLVIENVRADALNDFSFGITLKFGKF